MKVLMFLGLFIAFAVMHNVISGIFGFEDVLFFFLALISGALFVIDLIILIIKKLRKT